MSPRGYRHLSLREGLHKRLKEIMKAKRLNSVANTIAYLLTLEERLREIQTTLNKLKALLQGSLVREEDRLKNRSSSEG